MGFKRGQTFPSCHPNYGIQTVPFPCGCASGMRTPPRLHVLWAFFVAPFFVSNPDEEVKVATASTW